VIDETKLPPPEVRPYGVDEVPAEGQPPMLVITVSKRFDQLEHAWNWARDIVAAAPGPYREIRIDIHGCTNVSSMFFAGLLLLRDTYKPIPLRLINVNDRIYRTLRVMCMDSLFSVHVEGDPISDSHYRKPSG